MSQTFKKTTQIICVHTGNSTRPYLLNKLSLDLKSTFPTHPGFQSTFATHPPWMRTLGILALDSKVLSSEMDTDPSRAPVRTSESKPSNHQNRMVSRKHSH